MSSIVKENESSVPQTSIWQNFKDYARYGTVPTIEKNGNFVPANSFYESVKIVDDLLGSIKDPLSGVESCEASDNYVGNRKQEVFSLFGVIVGTLAMIVFKPLALVCAYTTYLIAKALSKVTDKFDLKDKTSSLIDYSGMLSQKVDEYSIKFSNCVSQIFSYALTAFIGILALPITPVVWAVDKIASKFSEMKEPEQVKANANKVSA
ncbi:hypothetical protein [Wolbachia endosymbiont of Folsomia candida]|uniref:hypothetical protein n=1 Tax=Wolbachia endosymbiont of Folsomia candida TaxID=169402 RepID=UPI000B302BA9|nr:hypothetical protein [Wolbachia endosymbiont of Folsomia candida]APR98523.1 hypothetical protein ASM33_04655 [Wolbachia endosymbiont of Folsomia candida]